MKTLLLLRHAKSSWDEPSLGDFDRPLAARGKRDAPRMGKALRNRGPLPDLIVSSPAARTRATIKAVAKSAQLQADVQFEQSVYGASSAELVRLIRRLPDEKSSVMIVGHNPGLEDLVARLSGETERMPTAALACVQFQIDRWESVEDGEGKVAWLLTPKQLDDEKE
ncbi:MAG TPA: histidine phosphatase family protein [Blastocatellia bacterium]|nr:histidine phosphatase family protein [Blastocatellia bacterium]